MLNANNRKEEKEEKEDSLFPFSSSPENGFAARERVTARPFFISLRATRPLIPFPPPHTTLFISFNIFPPSLPLSVRSLGTQGKKERRDGERERENGRKCGKGGGGGGGVAFLLLRESLLLCSPFCLSGLPARQIK